MKSKTLKQNGPRTAETTDLVNVIEDKTLSSIIIIISLSKVSMALCTFSFNAIIYHALP
jgi:hypothetical protein